MLKIVKCIIVIAYSLSIFSCTNKKSVLIVGDSILTGYGLDENDSPLEIIKKRIKNSVFDFCEPGFTVSAFSNRLSNYDELPISHVIIELGANDFLLGNDSENCKKKFLKVINYFEKKGISICLISFIDDTMFEYSDYCNVELLHQYEDMYKELQGENVLLITNIWKNNFSDENYKIDFFHPNKIGAAIIANKIFSEIEKTDFLHSCSR